MAKPSTIDREIRQAEILFSQIKASNGFEDVCLETLNAYYLEITNHNKLMLETGVKNGCRMCAELNGFSCCFAGAEEWYDNKLILLNMLFNIEIPKQRKVKDGCLFLSDHGCVLIARYGLCVNYVCQDIDNSLSKFDRINLRRQSGKELLAGLAAEEAINKYLSITKSVNLSIKQDRLD